MSYYYITDHGLEPILPPSQVTHIVKDGQIVGYLVADPKVTEPTDDPDDDIEAEVPDAREDPVPE